MLLTTDPLSALFVSFVPLYSIIFRPKSASEEDEQVKFCEKDEMNKKIAEIKIDSDKKEWIFILWREKERERVLQGRLLPISKNISNEIYKERDLDEKTCDRIDIYHLMFNWES